LIQTALDSGDFAVILEALRLVEERKLTGLSEHLVTLAEHEDIRVRTALVPALISAPTAQTMKALVTLLGDPDPDIRIGAVQGLSTHTYIGALEAVEAVVLNPNGTSGLTERRAFFEAYGSIAGESAVPALKVLILGGGFGRGRGDSDTRACATLALGRVGTRSARLILQKVAEDQDVVVRTAAARALRQEDT
jgi:HEAT repeat protein